MSTYTEAEVRRLMNYAVRLALKSVNPEYPEGAVAALQNDLEALRWDLRVGRGPSSNPPPSPTSPDFSEGGGVQKEAPLGDSIVTKKEPS